MVSCLSFFALAGSQPVQAQYPGGGGGGYPGTEGAWVPCDANGNPLPSGSPGLNTDGSAALLNSGNPVTNTNTYPIPQSGAASWWYSAYNPVAGRPVPAPAGLGTGCRAANFAVNSVSGKIGYYDPVNYTGDRASGTPTPPNVNGSVTSQDSDTLTAHFLWTGSLPPSPAGFILKTSVSASASTSPSSGISAKGVASLDGDTATALAGDAGSVPTASVTGYHFISVTPAGNVATVSVSGSMNATGTNGLAYGTWTGNGPTQYFGAVTGGTVAQASASTAGSVYPVTIAPTGTTPDSSHNDNILVGQGCTCGLSTPPFSAAQQSGWAWLVSGTTFQDWEPTTPAFLNATPPTPANPNASYFLGGYGPANQATAHWYWNDLGPKPTTEQVTCTATVTPPAGQGNAFTVSATKQVIVQVPTMTDNISLGNYQINTLCYGVGGALYLYAGVATGGSAGMNVSATCKTPQPPLFGNGKGTLELAQIVTLNSSYTDYSGFPGVPGPTHLIPMNGQSGLDNICPYPANPYTEGNVSPFSTNDSPGMPLDGSIGSATLQNSFADTLLYQPPDSGTSNGVQWVPRGTFSWGGTGTASQSTGSWPNTGTQSYGTLSLTTPYTATNVFPSWTQVITNAKVALPWPVQK